jgi:hypothetical protein
VFDVNNLSMKFSRHLDEEIVDFQVRHHPPPPRSTDAQQAPHTFLGMPFGKCDAFQYPVTAARGPYFGKFGG